MENICVIFGGRSVEHEVSVITGLQVIENMDKSLYNPIPLFYSKDGKFYTGEKLKDFRTFRENKYKEEGVEVFLKPNYKDFNLYAYEEKGGLFSKTKELVPYEKIDMVFIALHGTFGEDGCMEGLFELMQIPYVGCGVMASAVSMDKVTMKKVFESEGIPIVDYRYFYRSDYEKDEEKYLNLGDEIGYPIIVKPANLGSSVGISKAKNREELKESIEVAKNFDKKIILEKCVENLREINMAVMGYESDLEYSETEEPVSYSDILTYTEKYESKSGKTGSKGSKNGKTKTIPANISKETEDEIRELALKSFKAIDAAGLSRIDFMLDGDKVYVNEINTIPGSMSFYLWEHKYSFKELISKLIEIGKKVYKERTENNYSIDTNLFKKTGYGSKLK